jgi:hypothetical protein
MDATDGGIHLDLDRSRWMPPPSRSKNWNARRSPEGPPCSRPAGAVSDAVSVSRHSDEHLTTVMP